MYIYYTHIHIHQKTHKTGLVDPEVIAGRMGGRVLRAVGLTGKNAER